MPCAWHSGIQAWVKCGPCHQEVYSFMGEGNEATNYDQDRTKMCQEPVAECWKIWKWRSLILSVVLGWCSETSGSQNMVPTSSSSITWKLINDTDSQDCPRLCFNRPSRWCTLKFKNHLFKDKMMWDRKRPRRSHRLCIITRWWEGIYTTHPLHFYCELRPISWFHLDNNREGSGESLGSEANMVQIQIHTLKRSYVSWSKPPSLSEPASSP